MEVRLGVRSAHGTRSSGKELDLLGFGHFLLAIFQGGRPAGSISRGAGWRLGSRFGPHIVLVRFTGGLVRRVGAAGSRLKPVSSPRE
jgi:hypothetical protein